MQRPAKPVAARPSPEAAIEKVLDACDLVGEPFTRFLEGWFRGEVSVDDMSEAVLQLYDMMALVCAAACRAVHRAKISRFAGLIQLSSPSFAHFAPRF